MLWAHKGAGNAETRGATQRTRGARRGRDDTVAGAAAAAAAVVLRNQQPAHLRVHVQ